MGKKLIFVAIALVVLLLVFFGERSATAVVDLPSAVTSLGHAMPPPSPLTCAIRVAFAGCKRSSSRMVLGIKEGNAKLIVEATSTCFERLVAANAR